MNSLCLTRRFEDVVVFGSGSECVVAGKGRLSFYASGGENWGIESDRIGHGGRPWVWWDFAAVALCGLVVACSSSVGCWVAMVQGDTLGRCLSLVFFLLLFFYSHRPSLAKKKGDDSIRSQEKMLVEIATIPNRYVPGGHAQRELVHQKSSRPRARHKKGPERCPWLRWNLSARWPAAVCQLIFVIAPFWMQHTDPPSLRSLRVPCVGDSFFLRRLLTVSECLESPEFQITAQPPRGVETLQCHKALCFARAHTTLYVTLFTVHVFPSGNNGENVGVPTY